MSYLVDLYKGSRDSLKSSRDSSASINASIDESKTVIIEDSSKVNPFAETIGLTPEEQKEIDKNRLLVQIKRYNELGRNFTFFQTCLELGLEIDLASIGKNFINFLSDLFKFIESNKLNIDKTSLKERLVMLKTLKNKITELLTSLPTIDDQQKKSNYIKEIYYYWREISDRTLELITEIFQQIKMHFPFNPKRRHYLINFDLGIILIEQHRNEYIKRIKKEYNQLMIIIEFYFFLPDSKENLEIKEFLALYFLQKLLRIDLDSNLKLLILKDIEKVLKQKSNDLNFSPVSFDNNFELLIQNFIKIFELEFISEHVNYLDESEFRRLIFEKYYANIVKASLCLLDGQQLKRFLSQSDLDERDLFYSFESYFFGLVGKYKHEASVTKCDERTVNLRSIVLSELDRIQKRQLSLSEQKNVDDFLLFVSFALNNIGKTQLTPFAYIEYQLKSRVFAKLAIYIANLSKWRNQVNETINQLIKEFNLTDLVKKEGAVIKGSVLYIPKDEGVGIGEQVLNRLPNNTQGGSGDRGKNKRSLLSILSRLFKK